MLILALLLVLTSSFLHADQVGDYVNSMAQMLKLKVEKLGRDTKTRIQGQWYMDGDVFEKNCGGHGFFREFSADGFASDKRGHKDKYEIKDDYIDVGNEFGGNTRVYKLSGDYYIPSRECGFYKLVRGAPMKIEPEPKKAPDLSPCDTHADCGLTKGGLCVVRKEGPLKWPEPSEASPQCKCVKDGVYDGCQKVGAGR